MRDNIEYTRVGDQSLRLDASIPDGNGPFPAVIIVHGGAWVMGDRKHNVEPLFKPLSNAGFAWFSIDYRLANEAPGNGLAQQGISSVLTLSSAVEDVRSAVSFVHTHASEFHIDPSRIALIGESAGAQLAALAALKPGPNGDVAAVVALYCPSNLVELAQTSKQIPESIRKAVRGTAWEGMLIGSLRNLSPLTWVTKDSPPFLLIHGTSDTLVPFNQSTELHNRMLDMGVPCELYPVKGGGHGIRWWEYEHLTAYKQHMIKWLQATLARRAETPGPSAAA